MFRSLASVALDLARALQPAGLVLGTEAPAEKKKKRSKTTAGEGGRPEGTAGAPALGWAASVRSLAALLDSCRQHQLYRPTLDVSGQQLEFLRSMVGPVLLPSVLDGSVGGAEEARAAAAFLQSLLLLEHRPLQPLLEDIWGLVLGPGAGEDLSTPASVLAGLVRTYADLRQLQTLLGVLCRAIQAPEFSPDRVAAVVGHTSVVSELASAVHALPPGQVAPTVRFVAGQLGSLPAACDAIAVSLLVLFRTLLSSLRASGLPLPFEVLNME